MMHWIARALTSAKAVPSARAALAVLGAGLAFGLGGCAQIGVTADSGPVPEEIGVAGTIPWPEYQVGDWWAYSDGYGLRVREVAADGVATMTKTHAPEQWVERRGVFKEGSKSSTTLRDVVFRSDDPARLFDDPAVGAIAFYREYMADTQLIRHTTSWVMEGEETIRVPAGSFTCTILVMRTRSTQSDWTGFERWWYCPEIRNYARLEYRYGDMPETARVLINYGLVTPGGDDGADGADGARPPANTELPGGPTAEPENSNLTHEQE